MEICLHKNQMIVFQDQARFRVLNAGRRWGKTILAVNELLRSSIENQGSLNFYIAPTYRQAKLICWELIKKIIPRELIEATNEVDLSVRLINSSKIELKGAENEDSLRGVGLHFAVLDEHAMMKSHVWPTIIRPMLTDKKNSRALFISTPRGKDSFFEMWLKGQRREDGYKSWTFKTIDNPFIEASEVEAAQKELPDRYFRQEYEASFEDFSGLIYPEFNESHIVDPFKIPAHWNKVGAIDTALKGVTGALKSASDEDGYLYIYDEYYEADKRVSEVAPQIKETNVKWLIDPASAGQFTNRDGNLYSLYNEYADHGINPRTAENDVEAGINRTAEAFKSNKLKIFSTCKKLIWELERYHWCEDKSGASGVFDPKPYKENDHLCDCLRYIIMSRVKKSDEYEPTQNPNSAWNRMLERRKQRQQEYTY